MGEWVVEALAWGFGVGDWGGCNYYYADMQPREIVVTGLGVVTAYGAGMDALWAGIAGEGAFVSAVGPATRVNGEAFGLVAVGECRGFSAKEFVPKAYRKFIKVMARDTELAVAAANLASKDAGLVTRMAAGEAGGEEGAAGGVETTYPAGRMGCNIGAGLIAAETAELAMAAASAVEADGSFSTKRWGTVGEGGEAGEGGMNNLPPLWMLKYLPNMLACHVTIIHGLEGPSNTITCNEASGLLAIGESARIVERDAAEVCFAGSAESKINQMGLLRLKMAGRLGSGADRDAVGEAGGIVTIESAEAAKKRGARAYARVMGFGSAQGAWSGVLPGDGMASGGDGGEGLAAAIENAMDDAGVKAEEIDAVIAQGCGVAAFDAVERAGLARVFGARMGKIPVVAMTAGIGDCVAGNGGVHLAVGAKMLAEQRLPVHVMGAEGALQGARGSTLGRVLVCSGSMGGQNAAVVLGRV